MSDKATSERGNSRFPQVRGARAGSAKFLPMNLCKEDMMTEGAPEEEPVTQDKPPAVHCEMEGKFLVFRPVLKLESPPAFTTKGYYFRFFGGEVKLVRWVLENNGFRESNKDWSIGWGSGGLRSEIFQALSRFQKVNHFPRSIEITKKDSLFKNMSRMQSLHGKKHFDFMPDTFVLPQEAKQFEAEVERDRSNLWIVKPTGSSQGRGIFLTNKVPEIPAGVSMVASKYISSPLLINGLKFDLRVYVAFTSLDPLRVYIYNEGLVRFATEQYDLNDPSNRFIHLTNYSLNKNSPHFLDLEQDGRGFKWTHSALKGFFAAQNIDFSPIWSRIQDIVVKTLISIESTMNAGMNMLVPYKTNSFELLGFDILIDSSLRPWLLEVNLSPSLNTDSAIDLKVKSSLLADLFSLVGVISQKHRQKQGKSLGARPAWSNKRAPGCSAPTASEFRVIRETLLEQSRSGNFTCIFPTASSGHYSKFFNAERALNSLLIAYYNSSSQAEARRVPHTSRLCSNVKNRSLLHRHV